MVMVVIDFLVPELLYEILELTHLMPIVEIVVINRADEVQTEIEKKKIELNTLKIQFLDRFKSSRINT